MKLYPVFCIHLSEPCHWSLNTYSMLTSELLIAVLLKWNHVNPPFILRIVGLNTKNIFIIPILWQYYGSDIVFTKTCHLRNLDMNHFKISLGAAAMCLLGIDDKLLLYCLVLILKLVFISTFFPLAFFSNLT